MEGVGKRGKERGEVREDEGKDGVSCLWEPCMYIIIIIIIIRVHHVQKYTRAILPHAALSFITELHCKNKNQVW